MRTPSRPAAVAAAATLMTAALVGVTAITAPAGAVPASMDQVPRHGHKVAYPTIVAAGHVRAKKLAAGVNGTGQLTYGGGNDGIGVTTGPPKVYLVFWGAQWGVQATDGNGDLTFSGDGRGVAPLLQKMFRGIGTGNDQWSGVMTQYCETTAGATTCPAGASHVGVPTSGALAGVWYDNAAATPSQATDHQIGTEAVLAATHFGNTTPALNRSAQYVVVSPTGTHPGGYNTTSANWCAWHDWNGDTTLAGGPVASSVGDIAFTNLPYIPDMTFSCGASYVNLLSGSLDGVSIVAGHEYAETITDQNPAGGWTDSTGYENADKCSWVGTGGTGGAQNVAFTTGTFAMQGTYSNDSSNCRIAHAIVTSSSNVVTVTAPGAQSSAQGAAVTPVTAAANDTGTTTGYTWSASGLPTGITIAASTGTMSGTPTVKGSFTPTLTATDTSGASGSASFAWTITGTTVTVAPIAAQTTARNTTITSINAHAVDSNSSITTFTWTATGLPNGVTINSSTGSITGRVGSRTRTYTVRVTAKDSTGSTGTTQFTWTVR